MSTHEKIERLLKFTESLQKLSADEYMCESAKQAIFAKLEDKEKQAPLPSISPAFIWRKIMKSKITKLATAAMIIIAVLLGINQFGGSIDGSSVAWGKLVERVEQSHNQYHEELLLAVESQDIERIAFSADEFSDFWQGLRFLAAARINPEYQIHLNILIQNAKAKSHDKGEQIFLKHADEFIDWLDGIEDIAWINEIEHVCNQMEEYAEEIRDGARDNKLGLSYIEHCVNGFVIYCEWFEQLPWNNSEQDMTPAMFLAAIERDLTIARREIEALVIRGADRFAKRCVQQAQKNAQYLNEKIKSRQIVNQWKLSKQLALKTDELSGLMAYLAIAGGDITQTNKIHDPETIRQILIEEFGNKKSFADYFIEQIDQSLDLCKELAKKLESNQ